MNSIGYQKDSKFKEYLHSIVTALGGLEKVVKINNEEIDLDEDKKKVSEFEYVLGVECLACLRDLKKLLRKEEDDVNQPTRMELARWDTFTKDLTPILSKDRDFKDSTLSRACFELLVYLMTPMSDQPFVNNLKKDTMETEDMRKDTALENEDYIDEERFGSGSEMGIDLISSQDDSDDEKESNQTSVSSWLILQENIGHVLRYQKIILDNTWILEAMVDSLADLLQKNPVKFTQNDDHFLLTCLTFIKSLVRMSGNSLQAHQVHDDIIEALDEFVVFDLVLGIMEQLNDGKFKKFHLLTLDIFYFTIGVIDIKAMFMSVHLNKLDDKNGFDNKNEPSLTDVVRKEKIRLLNDVLNAPTRHSKFGGTNHLDKSKGATLYPRRNKITKYDPSKPIQVDSIQHLLGMTQGQRKLNLRKRHRVNVDVSPRRRLRNLKVKRIIIGLLDKLVKGKGVGLLFSICQKSLDLEFNDQGKLLYVIDTLLYTCNRFMLVGDISRIRSLAPLIHMPSFANYMLTSLEEFKQTKRYKLIQLSLISISHWIQLLLQLSKVSDENIDPKVLDMLRVLGDHQLHNFVHDYALITPLSDLYTNYYHPSISNGLIELTWDWISAVKFITTNKKWVFARKMKIKNSQRKRSKKGEGVVDLGFDNDNSNEKETIPSNLEDGINQPIDLDLPNGSEPIFDHLSNESSDSDKEMDHFEDKQLDFDKYMRRFINEPTLRGHFLYLQDLLEELDTLSPDLNQPIHFDNYNLKLKIAVTMIHRILIPNQTNLTMIFKPQYLHTLSQLQNKLNIIKNQLKSSNKMIDPESSLQSGLLNSQREIELDGMVRKGWPKHLKYFKELETLFQFLLDGILKRVKDDPWLVEKFIDPKTKFIRPTITNNEDIMDKDDHGDGDILAELAQGQNNIPVQPIRDIEAEEEELRQIALELDDDFFNELYE